MSSLDNTQAIQVLVKEVNNMIDYKLQNAKFDRTVKGRIIAYSGGNRYQVQLNDGQKYQATSFNAYNINEIVYVKIAGNDYNNLIIESPITRTNESSSWTLETKPLTIYREE